LPEVVRPAPVFASPPSLKYCFIPPQHFDVLPFFPFPSFFFSGYGPFSPHRLTFSPAHDSCVFNELGAFSFYGYLFLFVPVAPLFWSSCVCEVVKWRRGPPALLIVGRKTPGQPSPSSPVSLPLTPSSLPFAKVSVSARAILSTPPPSPPPSLYASIVTRYSEFVCTFSRMVQPLLDVPPESLFGLCILLCRPPLALIQESYCSLIMFVPPP